MHLSINVTHVSCSHPRKLPTIPRTYGLARTIRLSNSGRRGRSSSSTWKASMASSRACRNSPWQGDPNDFIHAAWCVFLEFSFPQSHLHFQRLYWSDSRFRFTPKPLLIGAGDFADQQLKNTTSGGMSMCPGRFFAKAGNSHDNRHPRLALRH